MNEEIKAALDLKFKNLQEELRLAQEKGASKDEVLKLHESIKSQGIALQEFMDSQEKAVKQSYSEQLVSFLEANKENIQTLLKNQSGSIEFVPKAVGPMSTGSGGDGIIVPPKNMNTDLGSFNFRNDDSLLALASVTNTNSAAYAYTELVPKDGDYAFVAEGTAKPMIDFAWQNRYATPFKIAAYEVLTEEVVTDIPRMESTAREYLVKKHGLFKANAVFFGAGTTGLPKGATVYGRTFVAGGMAAKVVKPNFMDVVNAIITDIYVTKNYTDEASYEANVCLVNPIDFYLQLVSAKDVNGLPLYPQAGLFNQVTIGSVTIKPWSKIPVGKIFVGDMKRYNIANYIPFSIRIGWINDQFITNQFTMLGESRFYAYVKKLDEQAFVYDTIETVRAAITKV